MMDPNLERMLGAIIGQYTIQKQGNDRPEPAVHNEDRMPMTREELDAKLELLATRSDARARETELMAEARMARFEERIDASLSQMTIDRQEQREEARSAKTLVVSSMLAVFIAVVGSALAVMSMNSSIVGNVISAFESGRNVGQSAPTSAAPVPAASSSTPK